MAQIEELLHGKEDRVHGDADYLGAPTYVMRAQKIQWQIARRRSQVEKIRNARERAKVMREETRKAQVRARVEHPFRVVKCVFGYVKTRFEGLAKNSVQIVTLFALSNLYAARKRLISSTGQLPPAVQMGPGKHARSRENRPEKKPPRLEIALQPGSSDDEIDGLFRGSSRDRSQPEARVSKHESCRRMALLASAVGFSALSCV